MVRLLIFDVWLSTHLYYISLLYAVSNVILWIIMNKYKLPRGYLSWSAFDLWNKNKDAFRRRYYENEAPPETVETIFGKKMAKIFEEDKSIVGSETEILVELEPGLMLRGFLDSFDESTLTITEFKTGHKNKDGKEPWDNVKVRKHGQLVFYSLLVKLKYGKVNPNVYLKWYETAFKDNTIEFNGHKLSGKTKELELTGYEKTFKRRIAKYEIDNMKEQIIKVANEITKDYEERINK